MKFFIISLMLMHMICSGSFLINFMDNSSDFFKESVFKAVDILNRFIILDVDLNILFLQERLEDGVLGKGLFDPCRESYESYVLLPPTLYAQKYGNVSLCDGKESQPFYHFTVKMTNDSSISFFNGDRITGMYDAVTLILHELIHGLGVASIVNIFGNSRTPPYFYLYDLLVFNLSNSSPFYVLNDSERNVIINGSLSYWVDGHEYKLYSKNPFSPGTSAIHSMYGLMNYWSQKYTMIRTLDAFTIHILNRMGYKTRNCDNPDWSNICGYCTPNTKCVISSAHQNEWFLNFLNL